MSGLYTNGVPVVGPLTQNGVLQTGDNGLVAQLTGYEKTAMDTNYLNGQSAQAQVFPSTVAAHAFDIAALYFAIANHTGTAASAAVTLNQPQGTITSETLTTAAGSSYSLVLTNSFITAASNVKAAAFLKGSTAGGPLQITSITPAAGSATIVVQNTGAAALNNTIAVMFLATGAF
jgi:hypothetical protein